VIHASTALQHQRAKGEGQIITQVRDGATRIGRLYQEGCAKLRFPNTHANHLEAVLINTAGGLTGGDDLRWSAQAAPGSRLVVTTQACERIYRSLGKPAEIRTQLHVGAGAHLDWLPQETILFERSQLDRTLDVELEDGASFCAVEAVLLGRDAMGEESRLAEFRDRWTIRRKGRLTHAERARLGTKNNERENISLLAGARAFATLLYVGPLAERTQARIAPLLAGKRIGMSRIGEKLVIRALAASGLDLRRLIVPLLSELSPIGSLPRVWHL